MSENNKTMIFALASTQTVSVMIIILLVTVPPMINNSISYYELPNNSRGYEITASWGEPSFVATWFNSTCIMGGMWAIVNGSRTIDIRNLEPDDNGTYSIINVYRKYIITITNWNWGHRYATWYCSEDGVEANIEWVFYNDTYFDSFIDPYFEYAGSELYNENATISVWNEIGTYDFTFNTVPMQLVGGNISLVHLNYIPMLPNAKTLVVSFSNETAVISIDRLHGTDFYRSFGSRLWNAGRYVFHYKLNILW